MRNNDDIDWPVHSLTLSFRHSTTGAPWRRFTRTRRREVQIEVVENGRGEMSATILHCCWTPAEVRQELLLSNVASYHGLVMSAVRCRRSYYKEQWMVVVTEEDLVDHGRTTSRN